jgi:chromosome condensin MukBEF MukE localization factor
MEHEYSLSLIALLKGIVYDHQKDAWENLLRYEPDVKKYFQRLGLELYIDKSEGYSYLRQKEWEEEETALPKLTEKRQLNFFTSLMCIVLRKYLLEQDAQGGSIRSIINEQEIINRIKVFLPSAPDEAKQQEKILTTINKVIEIGFLRKLEDQDRNYEIHRIIKGFVNADVIDETLRKLETYAREKQIAD